MRTEKKRSPLDRARPLRAAGQSLTNQLDDVLYDHALAPLLIAIFSCVFASVEWIRYVLKTPPVPVFASICAALVVIWAVFKIKRSMKLAEQIKLGRDGERVVAQYLEWFRSSNFFVFHDVPNGDANVDHVLIGPKGVFTIETKTHSKPVRGECRVSVVNGEVRANGLVLDRNPLVQAKAQANWLKGFLAESQFKAHVWPVVAFPGWFVEPFDTRATGAWVLEPKALNKFIENEPERLSREQVQAMASALSSYIRAQLDK